MPRSYRRFLLQHNGGVPDPGMFPIPGFANNPSGHIQVFFGIDAQRETEDIEQVLGFYSDVFPSGLVPIACTDGSDLVCLDNRSPESPIVFWNCRPSWGNGIWSEADLYPSANNFESFLQSLHDS